MSQPITTFASLAARHLPRLHTLANGENCTPEVSVSACAILLLHEGWQEKDVARECGLTRTRVSVVRQRFLLLGLAGLELAVPFGALSHGSRASRRLGKPRAPSPGKLQTGGSGNVPVWTEAALADEARALLESNLRERDRRMAQAILNATDRRLTLAEVARRAGVAPSTIHRWWGTARKSGLRALLQPSLKVSRAPRSRVLKPQPAASMNTIPITSELDTIDGLKAPYRNLLRASGVATLQDLANHVPSKLHRWMSEVNGDLRVTRIMPTAEEVATWVRVARDRCQNPEAGELRPSSKCA